MTACRCGHTLHNDTCDCGCEWDSAFCPDCGWLDCECASRLRAALDSGNGSDTETSPPNDALSESSVTPQ